MEKLPLRLIIAGLVLITLSVLFGWIIVPSLIDSKIKEQLQLRNGSDTFEKWRNITVPIYIKFTHFNVTNPDGVVRGNDPVFQEVGPFVYRETRLKKIENIDLENDTLTYRQAITYFFQPNMSAYPTEDVMLTVLNIPLVSVSKQINGAVGLERGIIISTVSEHMSNHDEPLFLQRTVRQMTFGGYKVPLFEDLGGLKGEEILPNNTFGLYYGQNGTFGRQHTVKSGATNVAEFGKVVNWNGGEVLPWWKDPHCDKINGSDGSLFPPFVKRDSKFPVFSEEFCRSIYMTYKKNSEYHGIPAYRFGMPKELWQNGDHLPENQCFCDKNREGEAMCSRNGSLSLAACRKGGPVAASMPYFIHGDEEIQQRFGWTPNIDDHETFIDLEPTTGMVLRASKRFQVNIEMTSSKSVRGFKKLQTIPFPIIKGEENMDAIPERTDELKSKLLRPLKIILIGKWVLAGAGIVLIVLGLISLSKRKMSKKSYPIELN